MLGRRKPPVLAEVAVRPEGGSRAGAQGRAELQAYSRLARELGGEPAVCTTGSARASVALGLATAAAAEGQRVALLECDLAEPTLAAVLGLASAPGLHEYLSGTATPPRIVQPLVLAGPASGRATEPLACIVAGEPELAPAALLASARCAHAVEKLRRAYDLLVLAGPGLDRGPDSLRAVSGLVEATIACGSPKEIRRRQPVALTGLVVAG
jgi:hypothetical protein